MRIFATILFFFCITVGAQNLASNDIKKADKCYQTVTGEVRDRVTNDLLPNTIVSIQDDEGNPIASQMIKSDGIFTFKVTCNTAYRLKAMKKSYTLESKNFKTTNTSGAELKTKILLDKGSISFIKKSKSVEARKAQTKKADIAKISKTTIEPVASATKEVAEEKQEIVADTKEPNKENVKAILEDKNVVAENKALEIKDEVKKEAISQNNIEEKSTTIAAKKTAQPTEDKKPVVAAIDKTEQVVVASTTKESLAKEQLNEIATTQLNKTKEVVAKNNNKEIVLKPIIFDYESSYLNKEAKKDLLHIVSIMKENPSLVVECAAFTDAKGSEKYNQWMSDRRAKRTVDFIISKGISPSRITGKGYGKTQLINPCTENANCTDEERSVNRRTEFVVVKQ